MSNKKNFYLNYETAVGLHVELMKSFGETRCGLNSRAMLESALARPVNEAIYNDADIIRQTARFISDLSKTAFGAAAISARRRL